MHNVDKTEVTSSKGVGVLMRKFEEGSNLEKVGSAENVNWFNIFPKRKTKSSSENSAQKKLVEKTKSRAQLAEEKRKRQKEAHERFMKATAPPLPTVNFTQPTYVLLLSYQRSGSSFMGGLLNR